MADKEEGAQREQWARATDAHRTDFDKAKSPTPLRVGAWLLWVLSAALEVAAIMAVMGKLPVPVLADMPVVVAVVAAVGCLALTLVAQNLWKKAGSVAPSKKQSVIAVVMACAGFALWALFFLVAKNLPVQTKLLGLLLAALVVAVGVVGGNLL